MKTLMSLLVIMLCIASSCKKRVVYSGNHTSAPPPLMYVIVDKNGRNILDTLGLIKDTVTLAYNVNGGNVHFCDSIPYGINKNNKAVAWDYTMFLLSEGMNPSHPSQTITPVNTFALSYHGNFLGTIYFEYSGWVFNQYASWQQAKVFNFNNTPVKIDSASGEHIYVIQLQQ